MYTVIYTVVETLRFRRYTQYKSRPANAKSFQTRPFRHRRRRHKKRK